MVPRLEGEPNRQTLAFSTQKAYAVRCSRSCPNATRWANLERRPKWSAFLLLAMLSMKGVGIQTLRFAHGGGNPSFAGFFLHVIEFLLGVVDGFLLVGDLLFVLGFLLIPLGGVTQTVAYVGIHGGGAQLVFLLQHVKFTR